MQKKKAQSSEEFGTEIEKAFNFTHGDLESNQAGFITHRQAKIVRKTTLRSNAGCLVLAFGAALLFLVLLYTPSQAEPLLFWGYFAVAALIPLATILFGVAQWHILSSELEKRLVQSTICKKTSSESRYGTSYRLYRVEDYKPSRLYSINQKQFNVLSEDTYRLYYLPNSGEILSIEAVLNETLTP